MHFSAQRFFNRPIALSPDHTTGLVDHLKSAALIVGAGPDGPPPYQLVSGVAVIEITGVLVHTRLSYYGETSYGYIARSMAAALADPEVKAIALHVASPGGEVDGCFELADEIYEMRGEKPIWAICDPYAYSAAYALACSADVICVPRTGGVGSIGVVALHVEMSKMLEKFGIGVTVIQFGDRKTERGPFAPLSKSAESRIQDEVDMIGEMFVETVARNRGIKAADVRKTQASTYLGGPGVEMGLADYVSSPQEAFVALLDYIS